MKFYIAILTFLLITAIYTADDKKLKMAIEVFRHGARGPIYSRYLDLLQGWKLEQAQELTAVGMRQHNLLGAALKKHYFPLLEIQESYNASEVRMRSTGVNRTIQSAYSQLVGLYNYTGQKFIEGLDDDFFNNFAVPAYQLSDVVKSKIKNLGKTYALNKNFQPFPVHNFPIENDFELRGYGSDTCQSQNVFYQENMETEDYKRVEQFLLKDLVAPLAKILKCDESKVNKIEYLFELVDVYYCNLYERISNPWQIALEKEIEQNTQIGITLKRIYNIFLYLKYYKTEVQQKMECSEFFKRIINDFDKKIDGTLSVKLDLYSAHDTTLMQFFRCLDINSFECQEDKFNGKDPLTNHFNCEEEFPLYASDLIFELYYVPASNDYEVVILKNSTPINCEVNNKSCKYTSFKARLQQFFLTNTKDVCKDPTGKTPIKPQY